MHRGYVFSTEDLTEVLCLTSDKQGFTMEAVDSTQVLNRAMCLHDVTEAKNILKRIKATPEYTEVVEDIKINNVARLYNKFF
jgi:hypothetical protein